MDSLDLMDQMYKELGQLHALIQHNFDFENNEDKVFTDKDSYLLWLVRDHVDRIRDTLELYDKARLDRHA